MKNFISMFLMTSLLLGGMTFTIGKMSVCAASKNRIETAQQKQAQLFGSAKNKLAATDPDFAQTMDNFIYGDVYSRGKLTEKQRELLTITALTASQTLDSLSVQVQAALKAGATPVEIKETLYQCAPYVGFPKTVGALEITNKVFKNRALKCRWQTRVLLPKPLVLTTALKYRVRFSEQNTLPPCTKTRQLIKNI